MRGPPEPAELRLRMALPSVAALAAVAAVGWLSVDRLCRAGTDVAGGAAARASASAFADLVDTSSEELGATLGSLASDGELSAAVAARDARRILAAAGPRFHDLRLHHGITHWSYWEPEPAGTRVTGLRNLVRLGTPTLRGDLVERETLARAVRDHALVSGIELGYTGFGLRAVTPVHDRGRLVGYGELGRNVELLLAELTRRTGDHFVLAVDKREVEARRWAAARAAHGERNNWDDREDLVLAGNPAHAEGVPSFPLAAALAESGGGLAAFTQGGRTFARGVFPLRDGAGRRLGAVFVFRDVTELARRSAELRRRAAATLAIAALLAAAALGFAYEQLVVRPSRVPRAPRRREG